MKIAPKQIDGFLAAPEKAISDKECRAALIYGADGGLVRERAGKIVKSVLGAAASDPFAKIELSEAEILADSSKLADEISAFSMMSPKRVIIISDAGNKLAKIVEAAIPLFNKDTYLLLTADELDSRSSLKALFEKQASCAAIACYKDELRDVQNIIRERLGEAGISYSREVADYLASQLGSDRYVTYQELDKIILYAGEAKTISIEEASALVDYNQETKLDELINALADRNLGALEKQLSQHTRENTQPILYLRSMLRYFDRLYAIRAQMAACGQSATMVVEGLRPPVFWKQKDSLIRHAGNWNSEAIVKAIKLLIAAEIDCKSSDTPALAASSRKLYQITQIRQ